MADILVVDDDDIICESLRQILEDNGHNVAVASDGREALNYLQQTPNLPSLILLDLMMPGMNGWQFNEARVQDTRLACIPVIVITATSQAQEAAAPINPVAVLHKPVELSQLLANVQRFAHS